MPRNGSNFYSLPSGSIVQAGTTATAASHNDPLQDLETDMNTARPIVAGGTGSTTASDARTALGLAIGSDVQAYDAGLASIAGLTTAADKMVYTTASDTYAVADLTAAGRALLDDADAAAQRTTLGLDTAAVAELLDEDDMASDDATAVPSQQSVKAYVDAEVAGTGIALGTQVATTSGTSASITSGIPSNAKKVTIALNQVSTSGTDDILVQLSTGSTFSTASYSSSAANVTLNTGATSTTGVIISSALIAATAYSGHIELLNVGSNTWVFSGSISGNGASHVSGGSKALGGTLDGVRLIFTGSDTFDAGSITTFYG